MLDSTVFDFPAKRFVYIYCMLKKTGSSFLRYTSYLTKTARSARVSRLSFRFLWLWFYIPIQWSKMFPNQIIKLKDLILLDFQLKIFTWGFTQENPQYPKHSSSRRYPANIYLFKVNNRNTKSCEICSMKYVDNVILMFFISYIFLVFLLLTWNK